MAEKKITRSPHAFNSASNGELEEWANDPKTANPEDCLRALQLRHDAAARALQREQERLSIKRQALEEDPFDPRTEVSADARKIVTTLWIIFILAPFVIGVLYVILSSIK